MVLPLTMSLRIADRRIQLVSVQASSFEREKGARVVRSRTSFLQAAKEIAGRPRRNNLPMQMSDATKSACCSSTTTRMLCSSSLWRTAAGIEPSCPKDANVADSMESENPLRSFSTSECTPFERSTEPPVRSSSSAKETINYSTPFTTTKAQSIYEAINRKVI